MDLVTADYSSGKITVFLGAGQARFASGAEYDAGPHPTAVLVADINGDGRPDVIVCNESDGTISILSGKGDGTLQARQSYPVGFNPSFIVAGDFNGSGKVDLAVAGKSGVQLAILLNDGNGNLQKPALLALSNAPAALTAADFNHDGHADLALANADGTVTVLLGKGAGQFSSLPDISVAPGRLSSINSGDLNKDGRIDLVVTQPGQKLVSVLIGKGDGTFAPPASYSVGNEPVSTLVADLNGDGVSGLVVINKSSNTFSILSGNGDGTFKPSVDFVAGNAPVAAVAGDFYGNGHVDLGIINHSSQSVSVPSGYGDGTFKAARSYPSGVQPVSIASGNLNGRKTPALVVANYCGFDHTCNTAGNVAVFLPDEKGNYRLSSSYPVGSGPVSVALADLNGDKKLDIIALNRLDKTASVLLGAGDGTFEQPTTIRLAGAPISLVIGDLNKDGKPDLAVLEDCGSAKCSQAGNVEILLGGGDGSFQSAATYPAGFSPVSVAVGDINAAKNLDLVIANRCGKDPSCQSTGTATVLIGDGTGKFTPGTDVALGQSPASIALGNLTGSGLDLVVSRSTDNAVAVLHGNGDGTFQAPIAYAVGNNPGSLVIADFNGDGKADVAVTNRNDSTVSVLYGSGAGTLRPAASLAVGNSPTALTVIGSPTAGHASLATANGASPTGVGTEFTVLPQITGTTLFGSFGLASAENPSTVNEMVTLTANITLPAVGPGPVTKVVFFDASGTALPDCNGATGESVTLVSGLNYQSQCITQYLQGGANEALTAEYLGDSTYAQQTTTISPLQNVNKLSPTLILSPTTAADLNTAVTLTATVGGVTIAPVGPTGTVTFTVGGNPITCNSPSTGAVDPATGVATCTTSALVAGTDVIGAGYPTDSNYNAATAVTVNQVINKLSPTLTISPTTAANLNTAVTFTATLGGVTITPVGPTGTVTFTVGGNPITCSSPSTGAVDPATGVATCTTSALLAGTDVIGASYPTDGNYNAATAVTVNQVINKLSPTLTISPTTAADLNTAVTLTATVGGVTIAPVGPTGTVTFTVGGNPITCSSPSTGAVDPATGVATCTTSALLAGTDVIGAGYPTDSNYNAATAVTVNQVIRKLSPTLTISPTTAANLNTAVTLTATVGGVTITPNGPTGTVSFAFGASNTPITCNNPAMVNPSTGVASCTTSALPAGTDVITASYPSDNNYNAAPTPVSTVNQVINKLSPTLVISPASTTVDTPVTLTATVGGVTITPNGPTGTVTFATGGNPIVCSSPTTGAVNPATGVATCTTSALVAPADIVAATYNGDLNYNNAVATSITVGVGMAAATTSFLGSSPTSGAVDQPLTFTVKVAPPGGGGTANEVVPSGSVTFRQGTTVTSPILCNAVSITGGNAATGTPGTASCPYTFSAALAGATITGFYSGDQNFSAGSGPSALIISAAGTSTSVTSAPSTTAGATVNQSVIFTATIAPNAPSSPGPAYPTLPVSFTYTLNGGGAVNLCTNAHVNTSGSGPTAVTTAVCPATLPTIGAYVVTAVYPTGDANFATSTGTENLTVSKTPATTTLTSSLATASVSQSVTFTATIVPAITPFSGSTAPGGTIDFAYTTSTNSTPVQLCASATVNTNGTGANQVYSATCTTSFAASGNYNVSATPGSDPNFTISASPVLIQPVGLTPTTTTLTTSSPSLFVNQSVTFSANVAPFTPGGTAPTGTVTFSYTSATVTTPVNLCPPVTVKTLGTGVNQVTSAQCPPKMTPPPPPIALPSTGTYSITATYAGDGNFATSSAAPTTETVSATTTTVTVPAPPSGLLINSPVTFTATISQPNGYVNSTSPTGTVAFSYSLNLGPPVPIATCAAVAVSPVASGGGATAACQTSLPSTGGYVVTAAYTTADQNFVSSTGATSSFNVGGSTTTTSLTVSPSPSNTNEQVTVQATVSPGAAGNTTPPGATPPTGNVTFSYAPSGGATVTISTCGTSSTVSTTAGTTTASCSFQLPSAGNYTITAAYNGDSNFGTSSQTAVQPVFRAATKTVVMASPSSSTVNQLVTFSATVAPQYSGTVIPTGTVGFSYTSSGGTAVPIGNCAAQPLNSALTAQCQASLPVTGTYTITAKYNDDPNFPNFLASSGTTTQAVSATSTTTAVSAPVAGVNQSVTYTATVTPTPEIPPLTGSTAPTGTVSFSYAESPGTLTGNPCPSVAVNTASGLTTAACTFSLPASGTYTITAQYTSGDLNFNSSTGTASQTVKTTAATTLRLQTSQATSVALSPVTFTATLSPGLTAGESYTNNIVFTSSDTTDPTKSTAYLQCGRSIGLPVTASANASCTVVFPDESSGSTPYVITATYQGDTNFAGSTGTTNQTVENFSAAFSAPASGTAVYLTQGYSSTGASGTSQGSFTSTPITVTLTTLGGSSLQTTPPAIDILGASCQVLNPAGAPVTGGSVTCVATSTAPATCPPAITGGVCQPGTTGAQWNIALSATANAAIGQYTVTLAVTDPASGGLSHTTTPLAFYVVGQAAPLTQVPGASGTENVAFNTATLPSPATAPTKLVSFQCGTVTTLAGVIVPNVSTSELTCTGPSGGVQVTGALTSVPITITAIAGQAAQLQRSNSISLAAFLGAPLFALVVWVGSRKSSRKGFLRFLGLLLLIAGASFATGCGGSFTLAAPKPTQQPGLPAGNTYLVQVIATDQNGAQYYAVVPLDLQPN